MRRHANKMTTNSSSKPPGRALPLTGWLDLMLSEIERKDREARAAEDERQRRSLAGQEHGDQLT